MLSKVLFVITLIVAISTSAYCWGEEGHKIVAEIATNLLTSTASNQVNVFCDNGQYSLPDIAPMPDDYDHTSQGEWSASCHFCNLPNDATQFIMQYCGSCCVVEAVQNYTAILTSEDANPFGCTFDAADGVEPCALTFLVHFVGDVHQPLHVSYASDRGGNDVQVDFFGESANLHAVWDTKIIERWDNDYEDAADQLMTIINNNPNTVQQYLNQMDPMAWANESFDFVRSTCYNYTVDQSGTPQLDEDYYNRNLPIIQWRLIAAGVRLGNLLNKVLTVSF